MEAALSQRDAKQVTSALRRCVLYAERCVQRMRLSDILLSVSASQCPSSSLDETGAALFAASSNGNRT